MSMNSGALIQELAQLSDRFSELGERLLAAARQLHAPGVPPADDLLDGLAACRQDFVGLRDRAIGLAGDVGATAATAEQVQSLHDLGALLDGVAEAEDRRRRAEDLRRGAIAVLDRVLRIAHATTPDFAALADCQGQARALRQAVAEATGPDLPEEAGAIAGGDHPFAHLVTLIDDRDRLEDEEWATLHESVGQHFGKQLAAAAARSKLLIGPEPEGDHAPAEHAYAEGH